MVPQDGIGAPLGHPAPSLRCHGQRRHVEDGRGPPPPAGLAHLGGRRHRAASSQMPRPAGARSPLRPRRLAHGLAGAAGKGGACCRGSDAWRKLAQVLIPHLVSQARPRAGRYAGAKASCGGPQPLSGGWGTLTEDNVLAGLADGGDAATLTTATRIMDTLLAMGLYSYYGYTYYDCAKRLQRHRTFLLNMSFLAEISPGR